MLVCDRCGDSRKNVIDRVQITRSTHPTRHPLHQITTGTANKIEMNIDLDLCPACWGNLSVRIGDFLNDKPNLSQALPSLTQVQHDQVAAYVATRLKENK